MNGIPRFALIGYGKMGKELERVAQEKSIPIQSIIDVNNERISAAITKDTLFNADVCIDFTVPAAVIDNLRACAVLGKNVVIGTTGWYDRLEEAKEIAKTHDIGVIYASNFSIGMYTFRKLVKAAGKLFQRHEQYDVGLHETHHRMKLDAPSGTALSLAEDILASFRRKNAIRTSLEGAPAPGDVVVSASRVGSVPGTHTVIFDSPWDTIELTHTARNRSGLAVGALIAAEWIFGKKGVYTLEDMLDDE